MKAAAYIKIRSDQGSAAAVDLSGAALDTDGFPIARRP
jgi:hypothetical protein